MSFENPNTISDRESGMATRRGRPPVPRDQVLRAAEALFADAAAPGAVSMDDVATAAGVGKATLFRAFGSRDGLLDALFEAQLEPLKTELGRPGSTIGPDIPPTERILALLEHLLLFKLDNPRLTAARELNGPSLLRSPHYVWVQRLLRDLIQEAGLAAEAADYAAHVLLGALRADLLHELLEAGIPIETVSRDLRSMAARILAER
jgi:AcrR family transcriptional regulator